MSARRAATSREGFRGPVTGSPSCIRDSHRRYYGPSLYSRDVSGYSPPAFRLARSSLGLRQPDLHAVVGRLDVVRKLGADGLVVDIGMQVGQDRAFRSDPLDPPQRVGDREMTGMRRIAQRVENPDLEIAQHLHVCFRHAVEVARICEIAEPEA